MASVRALTRSCPRPNQVSPKQLVLSHSPMRELAAKYKDLNVLVVGGNGSNCRRVAEHYGLKHVVTPEEVHAVYPSVCPSSAPEARSIPLVEVLYPKQESLFRLYRSLLD